MRKSIAVLLAALVGLVVTAPASAHHQDRAQNTKIARLAKQVKVLKARDAQNRRAITAIAGALGCFGWVPIAQYGDPAAGAGYVWAQGEELSVTTAIDGSDQANADAFMAVLSRECVTAGASATRSLSSIGKFEQIRTIAPHARSGL